MVHPLQVDNVSEQFESFNRSLNGLVGEKACLIKTLP